MTSGVLEQAVDTVPVLWMDDAIRTIEDYAAVIAREGSPLRIDCVGSIQAARTRWKDYGAIVIDCQMDPHDADANGTALLREINAECKWFPTFVYSGFLDDPRFADAIGRSYALEALSRAVSFERPIARHPFFVRVRREAETYLELKDRHPEAISFQSYVGDPERWRETVDCHWQKHHNWILREMEWRKWKWAVVCGEELALGSSDLLGFPSEEVLGQIGKRYNRVPFAYSCAMPYEEGRSPAWAQTLTPSDYYPTVRIAIADKAIDADFDTGAYQSYVSDGVVKRTPFTFWADTSGQSQHLGEPYQYFTKRLDIRLDGQNGESATEALVVSVVKKWMQSPFVVVNPKREVLIGRDLLRAFPVAVTLDAVKRETRVECLKR